MLTNNMTHKIEPKVYRTRLVGGNKYYKGNSITVTIPHEYLEYYNLTKPTSVLLIPTEKGILISKFEVPKQ